MAVDAGVMPMTPWYRQRWPWLLIAGPAIVVVASFITLAIAIRSDDGLVADDYYKQGLAINKTLARSARAAELEVSAVVDVAPDGGVNVRVRGKGALATPPSIRFTLAHATKAGQDRRTTLVGDGSGRYVGRVDAPEQGRWQVIVESDAWRLPAVETNGALTGITLRAQQPVD